MINIDYLLDRARTINGLTSDNKLNAELGVGNSFVSNIRKRRMWPHADHMRKIAKLADFDEELSVLLLHYWKAISEDKPSLAELYKNIMVEVATARGNEKSVEQFIL